MLNPKQQAKMAVLRNISGTMGGMMAKKSHAPQASHMPPAPAGLQASEGDEAMGTQHPGQLNIKEPGAVRHQHDQHAMPGQDELGEDDMKHLHDMYSKLM